VSVAIRAGFSCSFPNDSVGGILEGIGLLSYAENNNRRNNNLGLNNACLVLCLLSLFFFCLRIRWWITLIYSEL